MSVRKSQNIFFISVWVLLLSTFALIKYKLRDCKNSERKISSIFENNQLAKIINEEGDVVNLKDFLDENVFSNDDKALEAIIRNFYNDLYKNQSEAWDLEDATQRYLQIANKLKKLKNAIATASIQGGNYGDSDKAILVKSIESYFSGLYVLAWHHAYLFHRDKLPNKSNEESCLDFSIIKSWDALKGCSLPLEKEFALYANKNLGGELINVSLTEENTSKEEKAIIQYTLKNIPRTKSYVALAKLDLSQEMKNFVEHSSLKNWKDPYYYAKFLTFAGLREAMGNYWSILRYSSSYQQLIQHEDNNQFLLTASYKKNEYWNQNSYIKELFNKDFYYNVINSYSLSSTENKNEIIVNESIYGEILNKSTNTGALYYDDGRICKRLNGCNGLDGSDQYVFIIKSLFGSDESCKSNYKNNKGETVKFDCISFLRDYFYQKGKFSFLSKNNDSVIESEIIPEDKRRDIQNIISNFLQSNPGLVTNALLPGDDFSNSIYDLKKDIPNAKELSGKILSSSIVAKNMLISRLLYKVLGIDLVSWYNPTNQYKLEKFSEDEKTLVFKTIYCRSAEIMWGMNSDDLNNDLIKCDVNSRSTSSYYNNIVEKLNVKLVSKFEQKKISYKNLSEKYDELMYFSNLVDASNVAKYLREGKSSPVKLRPFDRRTLEIYAKIMTGNIGSSQMLYSGEKNRFNYLENSGFLDAAFAEIETRFGAICKRAQGLASCDPLKITSIQEKSMYLRRAVYEAVYGSLARTMYPWVQPDNYVTPNKNKKLIEVVNSLENGGPTLPSWFGMDVRKKFEDYFYYVADQVLNFKCEESIIKKVEASSFQNDVKNFDMLNVNQANFVKSATLNSLISENSKSEANWQSNFYKLMNYAGQWNIANKCGQAKDFFENGFAWILLGKALGLFNLEVLKNGEFSLVSYKEEPKITDYNEIHAKYVYQLMVDRFPFLGREGKGKNWHSDEFLDLQYLKPDAKQIGVELIKKLLEKSWSDFDPPNQKDILNSYSSIKFSDKGQLSNFANDKNFEMLFNHFENFRSKYNSYQVAKEKIVSSKVDAKNFLNNYDQIDKWIGETADKKIVNTYHPWAARWEIVKKYITPAVIVLSTLLSVFGWLVGGVEFLTVAFIKMLIVADTLSIALILSDSGFNLIYKDMYEIPNTIASQTKVASAFSFYSRGALPENGSGWKVKLSSASEKTSELINEGNKFSDLVWADSLEAQTYQNVSESKNKLKSKTIMDGIDLGLNSVLFYLPVSSQIKRNFLVLKNGRTLEQVMKAAGLPYMNFPQRVRYFFGKSPEVTELVGHLEEGSTKAFAKKIVLSVDPKSQVVMMNSKGMKSLEQAFFLNLIQKDNKSRELIHLLYPQASTKSLNPKIDLMHEELELYLNFMKTVISGIDRLPLAKYKELSILIKEAGYLEHSTLVFSKLEDWIKRGKVLDEALEDEIKLLHNLYGNMPIKNGAIFGDLSRASLLHANGGDLLALKLVGSGPKAEGAASEAMKSFINVENVIEFYDQMLNVSKSKWHEVSEKYLQAQFKNTLKLEENLLMNIKNRKSVVPYDANASSTAKTFVEQLSLEEKVIMEKQLSKAWLIELGETSEGAELGLMMMLRDFQGMYASLKKSPKLLSFINENIGKSVGIENYLNYLNRADAPLYAQLLSSWSSSGNIVQKMNETLDKLQNGAGLYHYVEVPIGSESFRTKGILNSGIPIN